MQCRVHSSLRSLSFEGTALGGEAFTALLEV
jgi:hypothetical protein